MKPALYLCLVVLFLSANRQAVYAQHNFREQVKKTFASGRWQTGLTGGYGRGSIFDNHTVFQARGGYYVVDKLLVGIGASWAKESEGSIALHDLAVGPLARYQFTHTRLSPFIEASYQFGRRRVNAEWRMSYPGYASTQTALVSPGLSIKLASSWRVDVSYGFQFTTLDGYNYSFGKPQFGINYLFGGN